MTSGTPARIGLFSSNKLFGQPGLYPAGSPMAPASPPGWPTWSEPLSREVVASLAPSALERFDSDTDLLAAAPDPAVRAALCCLTGTIAAPLFDAFPHTTEVTLLRYGRPAAPGRVVGPAEDAGEPTLRIVNDRYRYEHPALLAPSLAHDLLWTPDRTGHAAETLLHLVAAMVHIQLIVRSPDHAQVGTELSRRQNSLAITLLNSRHPGSPRPTLIAPDGLGTIPGGDPALQTPDFWSVPFGPVDGDADAGCPAPPLLDAVLDHLVPASTPRPSPLLLDDHLAEWLDEHLDDRWLRAGDRDAARFALTLAD